ncbi:hypothetical protein RERY_55510 [Rhodococcus erythropolis]|nr:hypothetical protein RERY_55510 [Rhodococcus erythropolis]
MLRTRQTEHRDIEGQSHHERVHCQEVREERMYRLNQHSGRRPRIRPIVGDPVIVPIATAASAPEIIMPSNEMFSVPARSATHSSAPQGRVGWSGG